MTKIKQSDVKDKKKRLPQWIVDHFEASIYSHEKLHQIIHLSASGISVLREIPNAVKALALVNGTLEATESKTKLENAKKEAALAEREIAEDFPVLHGLALVALWSWLENLVKGLLVLWLTHRKDSYEASLVQKLKIRLGDFLQLSKSDQAYHIVELLEQDTSSSLKKGVNRFESLLATFGLSGDVPEICSRNLFELQQLRNAIVHRNGVVDRKLKTACPWLKLKLGQRVLVDSTTLQRHSESTFKYLLIILYRVGDLYQLDLRQKNNSDA